MGSQQQVGESKVALFFVVAVLGVLLGCGAAAKVEPISAKAEQVDVRKASPPPGAKSLGPIEAVHGSGCGMYGSAGTFEGAMNLIKQEAANRGANYVELITVTEPHSENGCFDQEFRMRGMAYRIRRARAPRAKERNESAQAAAAPATGCNPPCSPGFACETNVCKPLCNPACAKDEYCGNDRLCHASTPVAAPVPADAEPAKSDATSEL